MRGSGRLLVAGLALTLCAAPGTATAAAKEPVSGGLYSLPGAEPLAPATATAAPQAYPAPAPAPVPVPVETRIGDDTSWGLLVRGGYFGVPNFIADELFYKHPEVTGIELRRRDPLPRGGRRAGRRERRPLGRLPPRPRPTASGRQEESDTPELVSGDIDMLAFTLTGYWSLFPTWYVHPYVGIGIGVAHVTGYYLDQDEIVEADIWVPVLHIPVGLAIELGKRLQLAIEGRFIDGIAIGGALQVRF